MNDPLVIAGREFGSRLITGTGKYPDFETMHGAVEASGCELVTVAVRRVDLDNLGDDIVGHLPEERLVADGFTVLPYVMPDPVLQVKLEDAGCAAVMPLAAPIGSGRGLKLLYAIQIMIEQRSVPVVVDAGLGAPSHAAEAMELGADAVLVNTAIARARDPVEMARAFRLGVEAGRGAHLAGLVEEREAAAASSPVSGLVTHP